MREINKYDIPEIWEYIKHFISQTPESFLRDLDNKECVERLLYRIIAGAGIGYIEEGQGIILGVITPCVWCDRTLMLSELAWYVKPEFRHTRTAYKLLKKYIEKGKSLKEENKIKVFTMGKLVNSPNIKYEKFGFSKLEESWIQ